MTGADLSKLVRWFSGLRVTVIGDAMLDTYSRGTVNRICREAPVPIVTVEEREDVPGGAANTAANVAALGAQARLVGVVGDDLEGVLLRQELEGRRVDTECLVTVPGRWTLSKHRVLAESHMFVRVDQGSTRPVDDITEARLINALVDAFGDSDAIIVSDYEYGVVSPRVIETLRRLQAHHQRVLVVDAKDLRKYAGAQATAVKPNYTEALLLAGMAQGNRRARAEAGALLGERVLEATGARIAAVTLDSEGALVFERGAPPYRTYAPRSRSAQTAGAGDTFAAALTLALAGGAGTTEAAEVASAAAGIVVAKEGTAICYADDLCVQLAAEGKYAEDLEVLVARVALLRQQGQRIVFTNGCFDIIHRGHVTYLSQAKTLGDVLIVGVNSDESTRRLKGPARPINPLDDRLSVLASMSCVDHLISFNDDIPERIIASIRPDVFVKGADYTRETLPEAPLVESLGGKVEFLPFVDDRSTTEIISRVRQAYAERG